MASGPDLATLTLSVDSSSVDAGAASLDRLATAAGRTGASTTAFTGIMTAAQIAAARAGVSLINATPHVDKFGRSLTLSGQQAQFLTFQLNDVITSIASGISPMQTLAQQGGQVYQALAMGQGGLGGGIRALANTLTTFISPLRLVTFGVAALGVTTALAYRSFINGQKDIQYGLAGVGAASGATVDSINRVSRAATELAGISVATGREMATAFAGSRVSIDQIPRLLQTTQQYARSMGIDLSDATEMMTKAFADPSKGAETLNVAIGRIDDRTRNYVRTMMDQGNRAEATRVLMEAVSGSLEGQATRVGILTRAWNALSNSYEAWGRLTDKALGGGTNEELLERARKELETLRSSRGGIAETLKPGGKEFNDSAEAQLNKTIQELEGKIAATTQRTTDTLKTELADKASAVVRGVITDLQGLADLQSQLKILETARGDSEAMQRMGVSSEALEEAIAQLQARTDNYKSSLDRMIQNYHLEIASLNAVTLAEKAQAAANLEYQRVLNSGKSELEANTAMELARNRVIAEGTRAAADAVRQSRKDNALVGLRPYEAAMERSRQQRNENNSNWNLGGDTGTIVTTPLTAITSTVSTAVRSVSTGIRAEVEAYVRAAAEARGIDPNVAARVIAQESSFKHDARGDGGLSYGPMQLYTGGGLGNEALKKGISLDPSNWRQQVDFGMDVVKKDGWRQWYGARDVGISRWQGIGGQSAGGIPQQQLPGNRQTVGEMPAGAGGAADEIMNNQQRAVQWQFVGEQIRSANDAITEQLSLAQTQHATFTQGIEQTTAAAEAQRMYNQFTQAGVPITAALRTEVEAYAARAGQAAGAIQQMQHQQEMLATMNNIGRDAVKGFVSDLIAGKSATEALTNALSKMLDKLLDMALNNIFSMGGTAGSGGLFGQIFGSLFGMGNGAGTALQGSGAGKASGGDVYGGQSLFVGEHGPERFTPSVPGHITPAGGGGLNVIINEAPGTQTSVSQNDDGSLTIDTIARGLEGRLADRVNRNKGPLGRAAGASLSRSNLRG